MYRVFLRRGCVHIDCGTVVSPNALLAANTAATIHGKGLFKVQPMTDDPNQGWESFSFRF